MTRDERDPLLLTAVLDASGGTRAELDEQYLLSAFVVHRAEPGETPIVVELLDHGPSHTPHRWQAMAHDEGSGSATALGRGATPEDALGALNWDLMR